VQQTLWSIKYHLYWCKNGFFLLLSANVNVMEWWWRWWYGKTFSSSKTLQLHFLCHVRERRNFHCNSSRLRFKRQMDLHMIHLKTHTGIENPWDNKDAYNYNPIAKLMWFHYRQTILRKILDITSRGIKL